MIKHFNKVLLGTTLAKAIGFVREVIFLFFLSNSILYSEILSLLAISTLLISLSDTSFLNPILYPLWKNNNSEKVTLYVNHFLIVVFASCFFFVFNEATLKLNQPLYVKIICATLWVPLIIHGIGYSVSLYKKQLNVYNFLLNSISLIYVVIFWLFKELGPEAYIISRTTSILYGGTFVLLVFSKNFEVKFKFQKIDYKNLFNSIVRFANVNNFIISIFLIKFIFSQFFIEEVAIINYSLVIVFIFYTLINKNLNAFTITESKKEQIKGRKIQLKYFIIYLIFLILTRFLVEHVPNSILGFNNMKVLLEVLQVSLCFTPIILLCGIYDLINSEIVLNDNPKYKTKNIFIIIFSLISFSIPYYFLF